MTISTILVSACISVFGAFHSTCPLAAQNDPDRVLAYYEFNSQDKNEDVLLYRKGGHLMAEVSVTGQENEMGRPTGEFIGPATLSESQLLVMKSTKDGACVVSFTREGTSLSSGRETPDCLGYHPPEVDFNMGDGQYLNPMGFSNQKIPSDNN